MDTSPTSAGPSSKRDSPPPECNGFATSPNSNNDNDRLPKFHVLDEVQEDESESAASSSDSDIPDDEIERMLEDEYVLSKKRKVADTSLDEEKEGRPFEEKTKIVLIKKEKNHFDILPEGWIQALHNSGMPLYLHKESRVCTMSRPYFLGEGSVRKHEIPMSAVPCLAYRKAIAEEQQEEMREEKERPDPKIQTAEECIQSQSLTPTQLNEYCQKLFKFKELKIMRFKSWAERRKFSKSQKRCRQRPTLPDGTKLITFPIHNAADADNNQKKEWIMNPNGKSHVCILHEYVQHSLKTQPSYKFTELENAATPYAATISINDMQYGIGYGTSKKQAKSEAARLTLEILIPDLREKLVNDVKGDGGSGGKDQGLSFFDQIKVEDPRVSEFCAKTTEPSPHDILLTCLQRNHGLCDIKISYKGSTLKNQKNEFTMTVGKHTATVVCRNKRDGKQRASQAILQALHPHITSWGSLLRLYGSRSIKSLKEKKSEEQEITLLQSKAAVNSPNFAILEKLKADMRKVKAKRRSYEPIGIFVPDPSEAPPTLSSANLHSIDL